MQPEMIRDFSLTVQLFLSGLGYFLITLLLIPDCLLRESLFECRPICITLAFRYLRNILMFPKMIDQLVPERFLAQDRLPPALPSRWFCRFPIERIASTPSLLLPSSDALVREPQMDKEKAPCTKGLSYFIGLCWITSDYQMVVPTGIEPVSPA